jgi:leucyl aminopeptidase
MKGSGTAGPDDGHVTASGPAQGREEKAAFALRKPDSYDIGEALMDNPFDPTPVPVLPAPPGDIETDLLVFPVFEAEDPRGRHRLDEATGGEVGRATASGEFRGKLYQMFLTPLVPGRWRARRIALVGAGPRQDFTLDRLRKTATGIGLAARERRVASVAYVFDGATVGVDIDAPSAAQAIVEGLTLAQLNLAAYRTIEVEPLLPERLAVAMPGLAGSGAAEASRAAARGRTLAGATNVARSLSNEPGNHLPPRAFADRAASLAVSAGLTAEVLDERRIAELGMGLLQGVAQGSAEPPRLLVLEHRPKGADVGPVLGLVGKGVTFDTGGISIKPSQNMDRMKDDMAGGAAVIAALCAIARLDAPVRVIGVIPMAENMPGGSALRPGDVLRSASGKTVEVLDTDAEGRLILGDALWYAQRLGATHLVDIATLTGACMVALGRITSGLFGTPADWVERVRQVAERAGDRSWPLPIFEEYREQLRSEIADVVNVGGRPAAAITAALFLKEFVGNLPWVHMDIAGTAWNEDPRPYMPKGPTGVGVRTLAEIAFTLVPLDFRAG